MTVMYFVYINIQIYKNIINNNFDVNIREAIKDIAWLQKIVFLASQKYN